MLGGCGGGGHFRCLRALWTGSGRDRTAQHGLFLVVPRAPVRIRMGGAQLSGRRLVRGAGWPLPAGVWRAIAPLMKPWCAEEVPTAANLNLHRGRDSCVRWHCDDEPLFGGVGTSKLIVSVSFGSRESFKWKVLSGRGS